MWFVYILECEDKSLYTGITKDVKKRFTEHVSGKGGNYTRSHTPKKMVYTEEVTSRSSALKREFAVKQLTRLKKLQLIKNKSTL